MDNTNTLKTLTGASGTSNITFGDVGSDSMYSTLARVRMRFISAPTSATITNRFKQNVGDSLSTGQTSTMADGKFDMLKSARFHRVTLQTVGDCEFSAIDYQLGQDGLR